MEQQQKMDTHEIRHFLVLHSVVPRFLYFCENNLFIVVQQEVCAQGHHHILASVPQEEELFLQRRTSHQMKTLCRHTNLPYQFNNAVINFCWIKTYFRPPSPHYFICFIWNSTLRRRFIVFNCISPCFFLKGWNSIIRRVFHHGQLYRGWGE
jgi:hypothetical protein